MPSYKEIVEHLNKIKYSIPPGWDPPEKVAAEIGCPAHRVREVLDAAIKEGLVEIKKVQIWVPGVNGGRGTKTIVTVYRKAVNKITLPSGEKTCLKQKSAKKIPDEIKKKILEFASRYPEDTPVRVLLARSPNSLRRAGYAKAEIYKIVLGRNN